MHAGNRDDRGGNRFQVNVNGQGSNLHAVWDYDLLKSAGLDLSATATGSPIAGGRERHRTDGVPRLGAGVVPAARCHRGLRAPGEAAEGYLDAHRPQAEARVAQAAARLAALLEQRLGRSE